jgi:glycosyltransferase involved in cell wall biosynthesis
MNVLFINKFFYPRGGAEIVCFETSRIMKKYGHAIGFISMDHAANMPTSSPTSFVPFVDGKSASWRMKYKALLRLFYSFEARRVVRKFVKEFQPAVVHLHNIAHQLSPSILDELKAVKIPIVMTLHDFKLVCPNSMLYAKDTNCERCAGGHYYHAIGQRCHNNSIVSSTLVATEMVLHHHVLNSYRHVDMFIAPSLFLKNKVEDMGLQGDIAYLPNFVDLDEHPMPIYEWEERSIVYFGRLASEKGLVTLCDAMEGLDLTLHLVGDGPAREMLECRIREKGLRNIRLWGHQSAKALYELVMKSMFAVLPSKWYENCPRSVIEAFAMGKPVIGANIGGIPELIKHHETGLLFRSGDVDDLRTKIQDLANNPSDIIRMGKQARILVSRELCAERHYSALMQIYRLAIQRGKDQQNHYESRT